MPILVNHELDMVEIRMELLKNVVDVFMISESNVTTSTKSRIFLIESESRLTCENRWL